MKTLHPLLLDFPENKCLKTWTDFLVELKDLQAGNYYFVDEYIEQTNKTIALIQNQALENINFFNEQLKKSLKP